MQDENETIEK